MKYAVTLFFLFIISKSGFAQKVFTVDYESRAGRNDGKWFFTKYESQADKKIYFVDYESRADLKIFFVNYESRAGWINNSKKHLMY